MGGIQLLENSLINKIAAGEVVERPVSIVKELVENAMDADATAVTVEIKDGGTTFIRVTDNGIGIPKDQVRMAFLRHATSKIQRLEDLESVTSLGFRGEALASIASVSQVAMTTKTAADTTGFRIEIDGGVVLKEGDTGATDGTSLIVRNVFFNTPARRKFLKKPAVESGYVSDMVNKFAIGHPEVSFKYMNNGTTMLQTKGNDDLKTTLLQVYGKETMKNVIALAAKKNGISLTGYIGKPSLSRGNRAHGYLFMNGRYIKNELVQLAVENAYKTLLTHGKFPFYVIKMRIDPQWVDVNVHPTKLEVRFAQEDAVYSAVLDAVSNALKKQDLTPQARLDAKKNSFSPPTLAMFEQKALEQKTVVPKAFEPKALQSGAAPKSIAETIYGGKAKSVPLNEPHPLYAVESARREEPWNPQAQAEKSALAAGHDRLIGQVFGTYWLIERENTMFVVDQHAAHERILYDELIEKVQRDKVAGQMLLQPIVVKLSRREADTLHENTALFEQFGFEVETFGPEAFALRSVPYIVQSGAPSADFFIEILDKLMSVTTSVNDLHEAKIDVIATIACKAAVKANDRLSYTEAKALIERVTALENPYTCPHGRPTMIEITKYEFEKKFKRV